MKESLSKKINQVTATHSISSWTISMKDQPKKLLEPSEDDQIISGAKTDMSLSLKARSRDLTVLSRLETYWTKKRKLNQGTSKRSKTHRSFSWILPSPSTMKKCSNTTCCNVRKTLTRKMNKGSNRRLRTIWQQIRGCPSSHPTRSISTILQSTNGIVPHSYHLYSVSSRDVWTQIILLPNWDFIYIPNSLFGQHLALEWLHQERAMKH